MGYEHTQTSPLWLFVSVPMFIILAVAAAATEGDTSVVVVGGMATLLFLAVIANFSRLTTTVSNRTVQVAFGRGWPKRTVELSRVIGVEVVRNRWFWGWGIRAIGHGWLWNVWGLDSVELQLDSGKRFRIGTDDSHGLYAALLVLVGT